MDLADEDPSLFLINKEDKINPSHYKGTKLEVIEVIEDFKLDYLKGNCIKYLLRAGKKSGESELDDLKKAEWYLKRKIQELENDSKELHNLEKSNG